MSAATIDKAEIIKANARGTWAVAWVTENGGQIDSHGPMTWVSVR